MTALVSHTLHSHWPLKANPLLPPLIYCFSLSVVWICSFASSFLLTNFCIFFWFSWKKDRKTCHDVTNSKEKDHECSFSVEWRGLFLSPVIGSSVQCNLSKACKHKMTKIGVNCWMIKQGLAAWQPVLIAQRSWWTWNSNDEEMQKQASRRVFQTRYIFYPLLPHTSKPPQSIKPTSSSMFIFNVLLRLLIVFITA